MVSCSLRGATAPQEQVSSLLGLGCRAQPTALPRLDCSSTVPLECRTTSPTPRHTLGLSCCSCSWTWSPRPTPAPPEQGGGRAREGSECLGPRELHPVQPLSVASDQPFRVAQAQLVQNDFSVLATWCPRRPHCRSASETSAGAGAVSQGGGGRAASPGRARSSPGPLGRWGGLLPGTLTLYCTSVQTPSQQCHQEHSRVNRWAQGHTLLEWGLWVSDSRGHRPPSTEQHSSKAVATSGGRRVVRRWPRP